MASERSLARRGAPHHLGFALAIPADQVVPHLLDRPDVRLRDEGAALPAEPIYELEPAAHGFTLTSDPGGAWRPRHPGDLRGHPHPDPRRCPPRRPVSPPPR
jgi:hypothetical protein